MKIGYIGLGSMGRPMAATLLDAGHEVVVHDVRRESADELVARGATWAATPRALAEQTSLVFSSLPMPADVEAVGLGEDGLAAALAPGSTWFDMSTNALSVVRSLQQQLAGGGVAFLDAPVSGGPRAAASGRLSIWVGGDDTAFERHRGVLGDLGDDVRHMGPIGAGTITKLTHNMAVIALDAVLAEILTIGVKAGVAPEVLWDALRNGGIGRTRCFDSLGRKFLKGDFEPDFHLRLADKDARLALEMARDAAVPAALCDLAASELAEALDRGWDMRDYQSFLLLQQERAGLPAFALSDEEIRSVLGR